MVRFILLTEVDPWGEAKGGQTAFARSLLMAFKDEIAVVCHSAGNEPKGVWTTRVWQEKTIAFFNIGPLKRNNSAKSFIPRRIISYFATWKYIRKIRAFHGRCFVDNPEQFFPASKVKWDSLVYLFSGVNNPVANSRYKSLRFLGTYFEEYFVRKLKKTAPSLCLAAASAEAIGEFVQRTHNMIPAEEIITFPTRVDQTIFHPCPDRKQLRQKLQMNGYGPYLVVTGRLCWIKGWEMLLQALALFRNKHPDVQLYFLGDGEDRSLVEAQIRELNLQNSVTITGFIAREKVAAFLSVADLYLCGSFHEGWSTAMCEALACGCPIVSTDVSGASDMIREHENGLIIRNRDAASYAEAMEQALLLPDAAGVSLEISKRFRIDTLRQDLLSTWKEIQTPAGFSPAEIKSEK